MVGGASEAQSLRMPPTRTSHVFALLTSLAALPLGAALPACSSVAIASAPEKSPKASDSPLAARAKSTFRETLAGGDYDAIPAATELLTQAYLESPRDPELALLVGHAHLWRGA